jgi:hypothetical protein
MNVKLSNRLNQILPRITGESFQSNEGIGNEIACYIFDYPAEHELQIREHIEVITNRLATHHRELRVLHLNLLDVGMAYLKQRGLLDKAIKMQASKGDSGVLRALKGPFAAEKIRDYIDSEHNPADHDLVILSGVGSVWPMLRAHSLLNCMHSVIGKAPLVMFYPGTFDGTTLKLFGQIATTTSHPGKKPYYRAFTLIPERTEV